MKSKKYAKLLGYNYQSSDWYKNTYKILIKIIEMALKNYKKTKRKK